MTSRFKPPATPCPKDVAASLKLARPELQDQVPVLVRLEFAAGDGGDSRSALSVAAGDLPVYAEAPALYAALRGLLPLAVAIERAFGQAGLRSAAADAQVKVQAARDAIARAEGLLGAPEEPQLRRCEFCQLRRYALSTTPRDCCEAGRRADRSEAAVLP